MLKNRRNVGKNLECCLFAYNTSKHESSIFTPFEVMFGRQAVLPIEVTLLYQYCKFGT